MTERSDMVGQNILMVGWHDCTDVTFRPFGRCWSLGDTSVLRLTQLVDDMHNQLIRWLRVTRNFWWHDRPVIWSDKISEWSSDMSESGWHDGSDVTFVSTMLIVGWYDRSDDNRVYAWPGDIDYLMILPTRWLWVIVLLFGQLDSTIDQQILCRSDAMVSW